MSDESKDIQVVEGDGSQLNISPVYDHINNIQQPRKKQVEEIVIPEVKKKENGIKKEEKSKEKDEPKDEEENDNKDE